MSSPVYLVLSIREIRNLLKIAKASVPNPRSIDCVVVRSVVRTDSEGRMAVSTSPTDITANGKCLWTGK